MTVLTHSLRDGFSQKHYAGYYVVFTIFCYCWLSPNLLVLQNI